MLVSEQAPNNRHILNEHIDRDGTEGSQDAEGEPDQSEPVQGKGLDDAKHVPEERESKNVF